jgi:DNA-binding HxlR family transcriptional regulator
MVVKASPRVCPIARSLDVVGEKWALLVVRELFFGVHRFDEIVANTGAPRDILTKRLRSLESAGVIERRPYSDRPVRCEYHLTAVGKDLGPALAALRLWGDRYYPSVDRVPVRVPRPMASVPAGV